MGTVRSILLAFALLASGRADAQSTRERLVVRGQLSRGMADSLTRYLEHARQSWGIPGMAVAIISGDSTVYAQGFGVRELGKPAPIDTNTLFDVASLTKSFTATMVATLVDDGILQWDAPVIRYLPALSFRDAWLTREITLRDLLSHRTGLEPANAMWHLGAATRADVIARARFLKPIAPFRTTMVYSNVGYMLVGEAAAAATGKPWEQLVTERVIGPLGLRRTLVRYRDRQRDENVAVPHAFIDGKVQVIGPENSGRETNAAASAVQTSVSDLARWLRFQLGDGMANGRRLVSARAFVETHSPQVIIPAGPAMRAARHVEFFPAYGLGWQIMDYRGHPIHWHTGAGDGTLSYMAVLPDERLGVVVLVNSWIDEDVPPVHGMLAAYIQDLLLGFPPEDQSAAALRRRAAGAAARQAAYETFLATRDTTVPPSLRPDGYAGTYVDELYGTMRVGNTGGRLSLQFGDGEVADLAHWKGDTFSVRWRTPIYSEQYATLATFQVDSARLAAQRLTLQLGRDQIAATRRP